MTHLLKNSINPFFVFASVVLFSSYCYADSQWAYCYEAQSNRIYFQTKEEIMKNRGKCFGKTYYQGMKNFELIKDELDSEGFPRGAEGSPVNMTFDNGRNILITHWNDLSKNNLVIVLEPSLKNRSVQVHCQHKNYSNSFQARVDKSKSFKIKVRQPIDNHSDQFRDVKKSCGSL